MNSNSKAPPALAWLVCFAVLLLCGCCVQATRTTTSLDFGWKFIRNPQFNHCAIDPFPINMDNMQCMGLIQAPNANTLETCEATCCQWDQCGMYQFCGNSSCTPQNTCWLGNSNNCYPVPGWISRQGTIDPNPPSNSTCNRPQCQVNFDDSSWTTLNVPHDFIIYGTFNPDADMSHGYLPVGTAWYRLNFTLPTSAKGKSIWITFDGVYRNSYAYLNGLFLGNHPSGYTSFIYDISNFTNLNFGSEGNLLAMYVDATLFEGWWYEGGGIYRHTWLTIADPLHIVPWGVFAPSQVTGQIYNIGQARLASEVIVYFNTEVINTRTSLQTFIVTSSLFYQGQPVGSTNSTVTLLPQMDTIVSQSIFVMNVVLWSPDTPELYSVTTSIFLENTLVDSVETIIGVRKVVFDADQGLFLNNLPVKINGVCNHQDFAGCGVAVPDRVNLFKVQNLKNMGVNGWRMSHNPPNPELLDFTDMMGIMVMDENRNFANVTQYYNDAALMVKRDRNHPSIILWSLCNENGCMEGEDAGIVVASNFKSIIKSLDPYRPIIAAMNEDWGEGLSYVLDVQGVNYQYFEYPIFHDAFSYQPLLGSETASCLGARGVYITNDTACHLAIYEADGCMEEWVTAVQTTPYVAGGFSWTGFDYKGEPIPYEWPDINSNFGTFDISGFPKDTFWYYQSWYTDQTVLHLFPHWNWEAGDNVSVWVYTNAPLVELFVDGVSQGVQNVPYLGKAGWEVIWEQPGVIEAKGYNTQKFVIASQSIQTTNSPFGLSLSVDSSSTIFADGQDVALISASVVDNKGFVVPTANNYINFTVSSNGVIYGVGNGDPSCHEPDKANGRSAFNGLARVIVQSLRGVTGTITLIAESAGLMSTKIPITVVSPPNSGFENQKLK